MTMRNMIYDEILQRGNFSFSRSGGPGGQNVNKVNTKVQLSIPIEDLQCLSASQQERIRNKLQGSTYLNRNGELVIQAQEERSQLRNREIAVSKMIDLIMHVLHREKRRQPTKPSKASKLRRLENKKMRSEKKKQRGRIKPSDFS